MPVDAKPFQFLMVAKEKKIYRFRRVKSYEINSNVQTFCQNGFISIGFRPQI